MDQTSPIFPASQILHDGIIYYRVVLTVSHIDKDLTNNDDCNLRVLCQRCHLATNQLDYSYFRSIPRSLNFNDSNQLDLFNESIFSQA